MTRIMLFSILFRYFGRRYLIWFGISLAVLMTVISLIQSIELMRRLSGREVQTTDFSVTSMALLNIPAVIELCLPFALQAGSMLCFDYWNRTNEFVVSRGFGRSIWSVLNPVICCACLIGAFYVTVINPVGSVTAQQYEAKMNAAFGSQQQKLSISADGIWLRDSQQDSALIIHGETLDIESATIHQPMIYVFNNDKVLDRRIRAASISLTDKGWLLEDVSTWNTLGERIDDAAMLMPTELRSLDLERSSAPPSTIAFFALPAFIAVLDRAGLPSVDHRIHFHRTAAIPLLLIGIAMIAARFTLTNMTRGRRARLFTRGVVIAVSIFMFSHFMMVLGATMRLPAYVAGWAPAFIVALAGAVMLARMDEA